MTSDQWSLNWHLKERWSLGGVLDWKRARTEEKKNERKETIYKAAFKLFRENGYDNVSFNGIASESGFTKSNMYRYFSSKDEIFLNIFAGLFNEWFKECIKNLKELKEGDDVSDFANTWVNSLLSHQQFLDLTPILFVSLERNSSYKQLLEFKELAKDLLFKISIEINRIFPKVEGEKVYRFLNLCFAATSNFWAASKQNKALKEIYNQDKFKELKLDFKRDLTISIEIIIQGIIANELKKQ